MARILPMLLVLALLGSSAAAFAVTEGLKLEKSPITDTPVDKVVAPDSDAHAIASIGFMLRKPDRLTVEIVNGSGDRDPHLARSQSVGRAGSHRSSGTAAPTRDGVVPTGTTARASISHGSAGRSGSRT